MNDVKNDIRIVITGDCCPLFNREDKIDYNAILANELKLVFAESDLNITNLECPLTTSINKIRKSGPHLKADPVNVELLKALHIGLVTLANNHLMDYGVEGYEETVSLLGKNGIGYVGAGDNSQKASEPKYLEIKGKRLAILNFTSKEFSSATTAKPGAAPLDAIDNYYVIQEAKKQSDFQIVIIHSGIEHYAYPTPNQQKLYRFYASLGVSAVIGHHSHCIEGYEIYNEVPIFYGLGNFIFPEKGNPAEWDEGLILELELNEKAIGFMCHKILQDGNSGLFSLEFLDKNLPEIITDETVEKKWNTYLESAVMRRHIFNNLGQRGFVARVLNKFFPTLQDRGFDHSYLNLLRNESNYEYIVGILENTVGDK